jgi:hypothetical protein
VKKHNLNTLAAQTILNPEAIPHILADGEIGAVLEWIVKDPKGQTQNSGQRRSESFTQQFLQLLMIQMMPVASDVGMQLRDTGNTLRTLMSNTLNFIAGAAANDATYGIQVGTGSNAPTITDYVIQSLIAHGSGVGQLQYGGVTYGAPSNDATTSQFTITRNFSNASGGSITVNEITLIVKGSVVDSGNQQNFLIIRDVIGGGIAVPNGQTLTANYRIQAVV